MSESTEYDPRHSFYGAGGSLAHTAPVPPEDGEWTGYELSDQDNDDTSEV